MTDKKYFQCTACGKCCYGQIPLTLKDAFTYAGLFPLCLVWTPVQKGSKDFKMVRQLGVDIPISGGIEMASLVVPTAFIPPSFPCPALLNQKICGIHDHKPSRCKTMPFYPYREERFQGELMTPKQGWECDISDNAPLVFSGQTLVDREAFDKERQDILEQAPILRLYAKYMLKYYPNLAKNLHTATQQKMGGNIITSLSSLLTGIKYPDTKLIAIKQLSVLEDFVTKTASDPKLAIFHAQYLGWAKEMTYLSQAIEKWHSPHAETVQ